MYFGTSLAEKWKRKFEKTYLKIAFFKTTRRHLTHWGRVTHICVGNLTTIESDNGLSPGRRQAIIWINGGILLIGPLWTNFSENLIGIQAFSFKKVHLKMSSAKWRPFCLGLNVLKQIIMVPDSLFHKKKYGDINVTFHVGSRKTANYPNTFVWSSE